MKKLFGHTFLLIFIISFSSLNSVAQKSESATILISDKPTTTEVFAAKEVRRYIYLRTGKLLSIQSVVRNKKLTSENIILIGSSGSINNNLIEDYIKIQNSTNSLKDEEYLLKAISDNKKKIILVEGKDDIATLHAAYKLMESFGIRYSPSGDIIPDGIIPLVFPEINQTFKPNFAIRGMLPYHSWNPEGPEFWNPDTYKSFISQQVKAGSNFLGLIYDLEVSDTKIYKFPPVKPDWSMTETPVNLPPAGSNQAFKTAFYGNERALEAREIKDEKERRNFLKESNGKFINEVFSFAKIFKVKTCIGIESFQSENTEKRYSEILSDVKRLINPDYFWISTPESWLWKSNNQNELDGIITSFKAAVTANEKLGSPFIMATMGWTLGPKEDQTMMDRNLPKNVIISTQNRTVGKEPVEPGFANIKNRHKWVIPWMEDDFNLLSPQLWVNRTIQNAMDAKNYGIEGFIGVHWRTKILTPQMMALNQLGWNSKLDAKSFYEDFTISNFGVEVSSKIASIFLQIDGKVPEVTGWLDGWPGGLKRDTSYWKLNKNLFHFVDQLNDLRPLIKGKGNIDRFDYYLNQYKYLRGLAKLRSALETPYENEIMHETINALIQSTYSIGEKGNILTLSRQVGKGIDTIYTGKPHLIVLTPRTSILPGESLNLDVFFIDKNQAKKVEFFWKKLGEKKYNVLKVDRNQDNCFTIQLTSDVINGNDIEYYVKGTTSIGSEIFFPAVAPEQNFTVVQISKKID